MYVIDRSQRPLALQNYSATATEIEVGQYSVYHQGDILREGVTGELMLVEDKLTNPNRLRVRRGFWRTTAQNVSSSHVLRRIYVHCTYTENAGSSEAMRLVVWNDTSPISGRTYNQMGRYRGQDGIFTNVNLIPMWGDQEWRFAGNGGDQTRTWTDPGYAQYINVPDEVPQNNLMVWGDCSFWWSVLLQPIEKIGGDGGVGGVSAGIKYTYHPESLCVDCDNHNKCLFQRGHNAKRNRHIYFNLRSMNAHAEITYKEFEHCRLPVYKVKVCLNHKKKVKV